MKAKIRYAIIAGGVSGLLNASALAFGFGAFLLSFLVALPLFLVGLGIGTPSVAIAALIGTAVSLLFGGLPLAFSYLLATGLPTLLLCRQALLARTNADGRLEWYPLGNLAVWALVIITVYGLGAGLYDLASGGAVAEFLKTLIMPALEMVRSQASQGVPQLSDQAIEQIVLGLFPASIAASWFLTMVIQGAAAQEILRRLGRNIRPKADLAEVTLPRWLLLVFLLATVIAVGESASWKIAGAAMSAGMLMAYFLQGLGVIHALVRNLRGGGLILTFFYMLLVLIGWPALIAVGLGLLDQAAKLKPRPGGSVGRGNDQEDG